MLHFFLVITQNLQFDVILEHDIEVPLTIEQLIPLVFYVLSVFIAKLLLFRFFEILRSQFQPFAQIIFILFKMHIFLRYRGEKLPSIVHQYGKRINCLQGIVWFDVFGDHYKRWLKIIRFQTQYIIFVGYKYCVSNFYERKPYWKFLTSPVGPNATIFGSFCLLSSFAFSCPKWALQTGQLLSLLICNMDRSNTLLKETKK